MQYDWDHDCRLSSDDYTRVLLCPEQILTDLQVTTLSHKEILSKEWSCFSSAPWWSFVAFTVSYPEVKDEVTMGSKVSSKMAAPTARVIQAIRPRAPLIKFPDRLAMPKPNASEALKVLAVNIPQQSSPSPLWVGTTPLVRPAAPFTRLPGAPDTLASIQLVPQRYRRTPLLVEEMDYIQRGGPE